MKTPFTAFRRALLPVVMLLVLATVITGCSTPNKPDATTAPSTTAQPVFHLPTNGLAAILPAPEAARGDVKADDSSVFKLELYEVTPL